MLDGEKGNPLPEKRGGVGGTTDREYASPVTYEIHEAPHSVCTSVPVNYALRMVRANPIRQRHRFGGRGGSIRAGASG